VLVHTRLLPTRMPVEPGQVDGTHVEAPGGGGVLGKSGHVAQHGSGPALQQHRACGEGVPHLGGGSLPELAGDVRATTDALPLTCANEP
jgi:hypothetical protein